MDSIQNHDNKKAIFVCLLNQKNEIVCTGAAIAQDNENFESVQARCCLNATTNFKNLCTLQLPSFNQKTEQQVNDVIDALIALEGYKLHWFYVGYTCQEKQQ